jgi:hypothetical protein
LVVGPLIQALGDGQSVTSPSPLVAFLNKAADSILDEPENPITFNYYGAGSSIFHALLMYAMRPNPTSSLLVDGVLHEIIPADFIPQRSIGLPIRASDKCGTESECLSFQQHVQAATELWRAAYNVTKDRTESISAADDSLLPSTSIVLTTESQQILREYEEAVNSNGTFSNAPFQFVTNHLDVAQDTGYLEELDTSRDVASGFSADHVMLSALSSLKAQLMTKITLGNCCSNFHLILKDLLSAGCGVATTNTFQCLQDHKNPEFRVCCAWDKSPVCQTRRKT